MTCRVQAKHSRVSSKQGLARENGTILALAADSLPAGGLGHVTCRVQGAWNTLTHYSAPASGLGYVPCFRGCTARTAKVQSDGQDRRALLLMDYVMHMYYSTMLFWQHCSPCCCYVHKSGSGGQQSQRMQAAALARTHQHTHIHTCVMSLCRPCCRCCCCYDKDC